MKLRLDEIPIRKVKDATQLWYVSAIAFRLEKQLEHPALAIAQLIVTDLLECIQNARDSLTSHLELSIDSVWHHSTPRAMPPGWIYWYVSEPGLAVWLSCIVQQSLLPEHDSTGGTVTPCFIPAQFRANHQQDSNSRLLPFLVLQTHARCCALLRLGVQEGLIHTSPSAPPDPFPWIPPSLTLTWTHPAETALTIQLVSTIDTLVELLETANLESCNPDQWQKIGVQLAIALSTQFQEFEAACRIFGEVSTQSPAIAQGRLLLVKATQRLLYVLLEGILGHTAPPEL